MKLADTPDFVRHDSLKPRRDRHSSWPWVTPKLGATYPPSLLANRQVRRFGEPCRLWMAYLVLLRVEIARFIQTKLARLCCSNPHLIALQLFGGQPLAATLSYAVRTFLQCQVSQMAPATA